MILVRAWRRELSAGVGTALIIPASLLAALAVLALAGGFARVGSLGQALTGPPAPAVPTGAVRASAGRTRANGSLAATASAAALPAAASKSGAGAGGTTGAPAPASLGVGHTHTQQGGTTGGQPTGTPPPVTRPTPPAPPVTQPTSPTPPVTQPTPPTPQPHPTIVDQVVSAAASVTKQLPPPVGPVATNTLQSVGATLGGLVPSLGQ